MKDIQLDQIRKDYAQANKTKRKLIVKVKQYTVFRNYLEKVKGCRLIQIEKLMHFDFYFQIMDIAPSFQGMKEIILRYETLDINLNDVMRSAKANENTLKSRQADLKTYRDVICFY